VAGSIFDREATLVPHAMRTVAERRFADAVALVATGANARANGAAYLAGFVIEILLKAQLVERYPSIARRPSHAVPVAEREVWSLIWRRHDLEAMIGRLAYLEAAIKKRGEFDSRDYLADLKKICATWSVQARYSTRTMLMDEAARIVDRVRTLKELLK